MKDRIKQLRSALNFTQPEFAEYLNVDFTTISNWETTCNLPARRVQQICHKFGVNEDWLTTGEGEMFINGVPVISQDEDDLKSRIKSIRKSLKLTQKQFAAALKLTEGAVTYWEREGKVPKKQLEKISVTFGVDMNWLLFGAKYATDSNCSTLTVSNMTPRELAIRNGCNELTAIIFERFFNLPNEKKDLFIKILFELTEQSTDEFKKICDVIKKKATSITVKWSDKRQRLNV